MPKKLSKFCYECGALMEEKGPFIDGLCSDCFLKENALLKTPEDVALKICNTCGAYYMKNSVFDIERDPQAEYLEAAKEIVSSKIEVLQRNEAGTRYVKFEDSENADVAFQAEYESADTIRVDLEARVRLTENQKDPLIERREVPVKIKKTTCQVCSKRSHGYYEALLQIRGEDELSEERLGEILERLRIEFLEMRDRKREDYVSQVKRKHGGLNLYTSNSKLAKDMGRFLKKEYGAKTDHSAELVGQTEDGKDKYRVTVVARIP
ncbi:MAG: NMD3-related protein [Candidatus Hadarchaeota archaeon]